MAVKIRFARIGKKKMPVYRIVAIDSRKKRDGSELENLGTYHPLTHEIVRFNKEGVDSWIAKGAQVSEGVKKVYHQHLRQAGGQTPSAAQKSTADQESLAVS